jgi:spore coat-associated protein N
MAPLRAMHRSREGTADVGHGRTRRKRARALVLSVAVICATGGFSVLAAFGALGGPISAAEHAPRVAFDGSRALVADLSMGAANIAPGDTIQRTVTLVNHGLRPLRAVTLTTVARATSALDQNPATGLLLRIDRGAQPWVPAAPGSTALRCPSVITAVVNWRPVIFPPAAGNTFQGLSSVIQYTFTGTQRTAASK